MTRIRIVTVMVLTLAAVPVLAQPVMLHPRLAVRTVVSGLELPTTLAFIGRNDILVLDKNSGRVQRIVDGTLRGTVLDLSVNFASERGLLGIALHPDFPANTGVYLYWSCNGAASSEPFFPGEQRCSEIPATGEDSNEITAVPLLGNRVDRFNWNGSALVFDRNIVFLRSFQHDGAPVPAGQGDGEQPARGNHDGGPIAFGPDGKLYVFVGDLGRRGQLQNLPDGPTAEGVDDDQFGGPEPDEAHLAGVVLRLNDDGSAPGDNPFAGGGDVVDKIFAYGFRNSFGMDFDPVSGDLWVQENGDDTFSELNRVERGMNGGWVQVMGPLDRIAQFKQIETSFNNGTLQQLRWPPENIPESPSQALARMFRLPGARYSDPEFSWKWEVAPGGLGFIRGRGLGSQFDGDMLLGAATPNLAGGYLFHFDLTGNRRKIASSDPRLDDAVADNRAKHDLTESESLLIGRDFGVVTDIETGPNGNVYVVSLTGGAIYEIFAK
jgi:glucose/arabinose dehydrogenase